MFGGKFGVALIDGEFVHASTLRMVAAAKITFAVHENVPYFMVIVASVLNSSVRTRLIPVFVSDYPSCGN